MHIKNGDTAYVDLNYNDAILYYTEALKLDAENVKVLKNLASIYLIQNKFEKCRKTCSDALWTLSESEENTDTQSVWFYIQFSKSEFALKNYDSAKLYLQHALSIQKDDLDIKRFLNEVERAMNKVSVVWVIFQIEHLVYLYLLSECSKSAKEAKIRPHSYDDACC